MNKKKDKIFREDVLKLIEEMSGCDAQDAEAKGWDAACNALYEAVERLKPGQQDSGLTK